MKLTVLVPLLLLGAALFWLLSRARAPLYGMPYAARLTIQATGAYRPVAGVAGLLSMGHLMLPHHLSSVAFEGLPLARPAFVWLSSAIAALIALGGVAYALRATAHIQRYAPEGARADLAKRVPTFKLIALSAFAYYIPAQTLLGYVDRRLPAQESLKVGELTLPQGAEDLSVAYALSFEGREVTVSLPDLPTTDSAVGESAVVLFREGALINSVLGVYFSGVFYSAADPYFRVTPLADRGAKRVTLESRHWQPVESLKAQVRRYLGSED